MILHKWPWMFFLYKEKIILHTPNERLFVVLEEEIENKVTNLRNVQSLGI